MCQFCEPLDKYKTLTVPVRTSMADDNICEFASPDVYEIRDNGG